MFAKIFRIGKKRFSFGYIRFTLAWINPRGQVSVNLGVDECGKVEKDYVENFLKE